MSQKELKKMLENEIRTILYNDFNVDVSDVNTVPTIDTEGITYPNLDSKEMKAKRIRTCVLYIDIRKSTDLNLKHNPKTLTKLYAAFMRSMVKSAQYYNGKVRNIIGDRIMVVFDEEDCFSNAVHTAILLNTVGQYLLNKSFNHNEVTFGIGIDYGRMLVSKGRIIKSGNENAPYKSLVWLGRPANVASKLTDLANKSVDVKIDGIESYFAVHFQLDGESRYYTITAKEFFERGMHNRPDMKVRTVGEGVGNSWFYSENPFEVNYFPRNEIIQKITSLTTPPILITEDVFLGYKEAHPDYDSIKNGWWKKQDNNLYPGYTIYGSQLIYNDIRD